MGGGELNAGIYKKIEAICELNSRVGQNLYAIGGRRRDRLEGN